MNNYHFLDHISDWMEYSFYSFLDSKGYINIKEAYFTIITVWYTSSLENALKTFWLSYKTDKKKISIIRKDFLLCLIATDIYRLNNNISSIKNHLNDINQLYFETEEWLPRLWLLCFHTANTLINKKSTNLYILWDSILRIANIDQFISFSTIESQISGYICINMHKHIHRLFRWIEETKNSDHLFTLTSREIDILEELRLNPDKLDLIISYSDKDSLRPQSMSIKRKLSDEELKDLDKIANNTDFWSFEDLNFHKWRISSGKVKVNKRFDLWSQKS